jgi:hypothetical protein
MSPKQWRSKSHLNLWPVPSPESAVDYKESPLARVSDFPAVSSQLQVAISPNKFDLDPTQL